MCEKSSSKPNHIKASLKFNVHASCLEISLRQTLILWVSGGRPGALHCHQAPRCCWSCGLHPATACLWAGGKRSAQGLVSPLGSELLLLFHPGHSLTIAQEGDRGRDFQDFHCDSRVGAVFHIQDRAVTSFPSSPPRGLREPEQEHNGHAA